MSLHTGLILVSPRLTKEGENGFQAGMGGSTQKGGDRQGARIKQHFGENMRGGGIKRNTRRTTEEKACAGRERSSNPEGVGQGVTGGKETKI